MQSCMLTEEVHDYTPMELVEAIGLPEIFAASVSVPSPVSALGPVLDRELTRNKIRKTMASTAKPAGQVATHSMLQPA